MCNKMKKYCLQLFISHLLLIVVFEAVFTSLAAFVKIQFAHLAHNEMKPGSRPGKKNARLAVNSSKKITPQSPRVY